MGQPALEHVTFYTLGTGLSWPSPSLPPTSRLVTLCILEVERLHGGTHHVPGPSESAAAKKPYDTSHKNTYDVIQSQLLQ